MLIHELGHACTALSFGWRLKKIEILPFGGVAEVDEHGNKPIHEEALVLIAGPFMNMIMIGFAYVCISLGIWQEAFAYQFIEYNLIILFFNLLPIWPLDGGKLMQLLFSMFIPFKKAIKHSLLVSGGCFFIYVICVYSFYPLYIYLWIVGTFLLIAQWLEWKQAPFQYQRFLLDRLHKTQNEELKYDVITIAIKPQLLIKDALFRMFRHKTHYFCSINRKGQVNHVVHEAEMLEQYFIHKKGYCTVRDTFG